MVFDLEGQIDIDVVARIDSVKGRLRATIDGFPDAPLTTATLDLAGGSKGLLQNSETLCGKAKRATTKLAGQNGAGFKVKTKLQTSCGSKERGKRAKRKGARR